MPSSVYLVLPIDYTVNVLMPVLTTNVADICLPHVSMMPILSVSGL